MASDPEILTDQENNLAENNLAENNLVLQKLRHIPRRSAGSTIGFAQSCFSNPLPVPSTTSTTVATLATKTTVINDELATRSVVTSMTMSRRRQSVQCPINSENQTLTSVGRRSRSLSTTCATSSSCSSIRNTFIHCSTTELRSHRPPSVRRTPRTLTDPLALDVASNGAPVYPETPVSRDLTLNIVLGYNHTIHRKVANVKHPELLGTVESLPMIKCSNNAVQNETMHDTVAGPQGNAVVCPKSSSTRRTAGTKPKPRPRKINQREIKQKVEEPESSTSKGGIPRKRNVRATGRKLVKTTTTTTSTQTQTEDRDLRTNVPQDLNNIHSNVLTTENTTNVCQPKNQPTIVVDGQLIEMKDELCFLTQQQLQPSDDASLDEMKRLLSFLTPEQMHCLHRIHKVKRKDDLMYLNLWQLHKMGIHQPEMVLALMQVALSVNVHPREEEKQTFSDNKCLDDDVIDMMDDDDDCEEQNLVIDEKVNNETSENDVVLNSNDTHLVTREQSDKALALNTQNDLGSDFKELLTEVNEITNKVHDKLVIIKDQKLAPNVKYQRLWPLYELLKRQEKRTETLWETLLNVSGKFLVKKKVDPTPQAPISLKDEDCQQDVNDEPLCILLVETEGNKNSSTNDDETEQIDALNMEADCEFLPSDILECSLGDDLEVSAPEMATNDVDILENEDNPPLAVNEIESTTEDKIPKNLENQTCSLSTCVHDEETETARELDNEGVLEVLPHVGMDVEETNYIRAFTGIQTETVMTPTLLTYIDSNESTTSQDEVELQVCKSSDEDNEMQNEQVVEQEAPGPKIILPPTIISEEISISRDEREGGESLTEEHKPEDVEEHYKRESKDVQSSDLVVTLSHDEKQDIEDISMEKRNVDCNEDEESPTYECIRATNENIPTNNAKCPALTRKSPRLHSETLCTDISNSQESDLTPTAELKKFKPRRLRIPRTSSKSVDDPRKKYKSTVYNVDEHNEIKSSLCADAISPGQTVILTNRYFRNKAKSKHNQDQNAEEVNQRINLPALALNELDNEDVELGMLALHSDGGETYDNSDKCSYSEESNCESSLKTVRSPKKANQVYEVDKPNRIACTTAKTRRFKTRIVTTTKLDPRQRVSYEDILTFSATPVVQIQKLKLSQKAHIDTTMTSSNQTSSNNKIVTTLKRKSLENDDDMMKCSSLASKVKKVDMLGDYLEDICLEYNQKNLEVLSPPKSLQSKHIYEDMSTTDYYSSSDERPSDPNVMELPSQDSPKAYTKAHIDIQHEQRNKLPQRRQEGQSDLHQQIEKVSNKSDLQQLQENGETTMRYCAATKAAAVATNKKLMQQQQKVIQTNTIYTTCNPYDDAQVKEEYDHQPPRSPSFKDIDGNHYEKKSAVDSQPHGPSNKFSNALSINTADDDANTAKETERNIEELSTYNSLYNKLSSHSVKRQINFENASVIITPIASPTYAGDSISSPSPVRSGGSGILVEIEYQLSGEIDGRMTYPPVPYILFEVDVSRNAFNKPLDINKLMKTNALDPRIFRNHAKKTSIINPSSSTRHQTFPTSAPTNSASSFNPAFTYDPRYRTQNAELQSPLPPASPKPTAQNAVVCYNMNSTSVAPLPSPMQSSLMHSNALHHSTPLNVLTVPTAPTFTQPQLQNPVKVLYGYLQLSPWYQSLMSTMKMQISQTISHLLRALNNFHRERQLNPEAIFDIFKIDCAGEILEIMSNLGLVVDATGTIIEDRQMSSYGSRSSTTMQQHGGTAMHQRGATTMQQHGGGSNALSPVNATYSFIQQVLTPSAQCTALATASSSAYNASAGSLNEPFVSCYIESPKPMVGGFGCGGPTYIPKEGGCCGVAACMPKAVGCNAVGTTCSIPKGCGCSVGTTCMNHHHHQSQHQHQHQNHHSQQNQQRHQQDDTMPSQTADSHCEGNCNNDRQYNQFRKPYQNNNNDSSQRTSYNQRYNNNSRYSKPSSYSGGDSNSPSRSGSPPPSSSSPPRGGGRGGGRGRGGFGRYNKGPMRGGSGGGGGRQSSSWSSSPPPKGENSYNSRRFNNDNSYNSSYNKSPTKTSSPPPPQRSPPPMSPTKSSGREGSPVLNSPARQQQQNRPASADEECWD